MDVLRRRRWPAFMLSIMIVFTNLPVEALAADYVDPVADEGEKRSSYTFEIKVLDETGAEISPVALTITGATATNRTYKKDSTAITISEVTFKDGSEQEVSLTLGENNDYTVTGAMTNASAGDGKTVNVTVTLK